MGNLVIFGTGGHAESIHELAELTGWRVSAFIDPFFRLDAKNGVNVYLSLQKLLESEDSDFSVFIAVGENSIRKQIYTSIISHGLNLNFPSLIHPRACVSKFSIIGNGSAVMSNSNLATGVEISNFVIIGSNSSLDHGSKIGNFSQVAPGAIIAGNVEIGENVFVGSGSTVIQNLIISPNSVLGAGSLLLNDLEENILAFGSPAVKIRERKNDELIF